MIDEIHTDLLLIKLLSQVFPCQHFWKSIYTFSYSNQYWNIIQTNVIKRWEIGEWKEYHGEDEE